MYRRVVADVLEMLLNALCYRYLIHSHSEALHECYGIGMRAVRRAESRHGDADDALARQLHLVEGVDADEQCERRVKASANTHYHPLA